MVVKLFDYYHVSKKSIIVVVVIYNMDRGTHNLNSFEVSRVLVETVGHKSMHTYCTDTAVMNFLSFPLHAG